jgi:hypothetical protein
MANKGKMLYLPLLVNGRGRPLRDSKVQVSTTEQAVITQTLSGRSGRRRSRISRRIRSGRRKISVRMEKKKKNGEGRRE